MEQNKQPLPVFETVRAAGKEIECTRDNTRLFTHLGKAAMYDHIFIETKAGAYQWRYDPQTGEDQEQYHHLKEKVIENNCPLHLNLKEPYEVDVNIYLKHAQPDWDELEEME